MCEFCDKIKKRKLDRDLFRSDHLMDFYGDGWASHTSPVYTLDDLNELDVYGNNDIQFCPKCGGKII